MRDVLLACVAVAALAGCGGAGAPFGGYEFRGTAAHPALPAGCEVATWSAGSGRERVHDRAIRTTDGDERPDDVLELAAFTVEPVDGPSAHAFMDLARLLDVSGVPIPGAPVIPNSGLTGRGARGQYSPADARSWGITFDRPGRANGGGVEIESVVLIRPQQHDMLNHWSPWRLVHVREIVYPDGAVQILDQRTLTNGDDAARFATY